MSVLLDALMAVTLLLRRVKNSVVTDDQSQQLWLRYILFVPNVGQDPKTLTQNAFV